MFNCGNKKRKIFLLRSAYLAKYWLQRVDFDMCTHISNHGNKTNLNLQGHWARSESKCNSIGISQKILVMAKIDFDKYSCIMNHEEQHVTLTFKVQGKARVKCISIKISHTHTVGCRELIVICTST